jgi:hypothetical protein
MICPTIFESSPDLRICEDLRKPIKVYEKSPKNEIFAKSDISATDESLPADARGCQHVTPAASALPSFYPSGPGGGHQSGIPLRDVDHRPTDRSHCRHASVHEKPLWQCRLPARQRRNRFGALPVCILWAENSLAGFRAPRIRLSVRGIFPAVSVPGRLDASRKNVFQRFLMDTGGQRPWRRRPEALFLCTLMEARGRRWKHEWCPGAESNHRHADFQSAALPLSYPGGPFGEAAT